MNRDDQFEKRLQRQPLREIPPAWREEILAVAEASRLSAPARESTFAALLRLRLRELFWPAPQAWAALAAVWLVILGAHFATREPSLGEFTRRTTPPSRQMRELLRQQEQLFAELVGPMEEPDADRPKPRSEYRREFLNA